MSCAVSSLTAGICASVLFVVVGLRYELQLYADGSIFSYAVAVQDVWAFHWHNISGRASVYVLAMLPAEAYVELSGDPRGGIALYGFLFFVVPLVALAGTYAADRSTGRTIFGMACFSTACLGPLVFGFPTEMWMAHALFWPALAICHYARGGIRGTVAVLAVLLALIFTHAGAVIFALTILATLALRGRRDAALWRATGAFLAIMAIWVAVKVECPPDEYCAGVLVRAALNVLNVGILTGDLMLLLYGTLAGYGLTFLALRWVAPEKAHFYAAALVAVALVLYWLRFDHALHAENRYYLRTVLLVATPGLGVVAAAYALAAEGRLNLPILPRLMAALTSGTALRAATGAFLLVLTVHTVEIAKFVTAWTHYKSALRSLAVGTASDATLGDPRFVSSDRIRPDLNRLSWFSTTQFLSVLVAPGLAPARLVVDPSANYFWLSCESYATFASFCPLICRLNSFTALPPRMSRLAFSLRNGRS
jgi:hypothetical protein